MSVGNLKTEGSKGHNYNYQHNVLKGLQRTLEQLQVLIANTTPINGLATEATLSAIDTKVSPFNRTPNLLRVSNAGSIPVDCYDFSVLNAGSTDGVLLGEIIRPGESLNFSAGALNNIYPSGTVTYDGTGTELVIIFNS
jgi:hypothetical protein